ncbi:MAG: hypothetical protein WCC06_03955 [Candidatus Aminicenantales bacterium]
MLAFFSIRFIILLIRPSYPDPVWSFNSNESALKLKYVPPSFKGGVLAAIVAELVVVSGIIFDRVKTKP